MPKLDGILETAIYSEDIARHSSAQPQNAALSAS